MSAHGRHPTRDYSSRWAATSAATSGSGSGYSLGLGYQLMQFADIESHWLLTYSAGSVSGYMPPGGVKQGEEYRALTAGLSLGL